MGIKVAVVVVELNRSMFLTATHLDIIFLIYDLPFVAIQYLYRTFSKGFFCTIV